MLLSEEFKAEGEWWLPLILMIRSEARSISILRLQFLGLYVRLPQAMVIPADANVIIEAPFKTGIVLGRLGDGRKCTLLDNVRISVSDAADRPCTFRSTRALIGPIL